MAKTFYTADTHFQDGRLFEKSRRQLGSVDAMDHHIIENWNRVVGHNDVVWHLGDFAKTPSLEKVAEIFASLNGRKRLVLGNHDYIRPGVVHPVIAALRWDEPPRDLVETVSDDGHRIILCHYALRSWPGQVKGSYHFYGHDHGELPEFGRSRDVGVDVADTSFTPQTFNDLALSLTS